MPDPTSLAEVVRGISQPDPASRPMMRWWWFGPDVETAELDRELYAVRDAGIGGVEVSFVYPLRPGSPPFLGAAMLSHLGHAARTAHALGLRFDVTLGSGWSYGGAHIGAEHASRKLHWEGRDISAEAFDVPAAASWPGDELVAAYLGDGFPPESWLLLPIEDGSVRIPAGRGPRTVLLAWSCVTGQQVKRASAGADGPVLDHLSADATRHHLETVGDRLLEAVPAELIGSVFSDSLEVYEANWTQEFPAEFSRRRGYDVIPLLYRLQVDEPGSEQLRTDVGRTLTELVEENFIATCQAWARERGVTFRLQGYGEPPVTMSSNRFSDLIEGEGCGWTELTQLRWASSAAHVYGRDVISSEVWTWVHSPSFRATPLDLKGEAHEHFLLGSNHLIGHGWPYSPPDAPGQGWMFYAAGALDDRNPWWPAMPELAAYLTRLSWLLRQGRPVADIKLYLPLADVRAAHGAGFDLWKACRDHIGPEIPAAIRRGGYDFDVIDDDALDVLDPSAAPVVVLPGITQLPERARAWCEQVQQAGGTVISVDSAAFPAGISVRRASFADVLWEVLAPDVALQGDGGEIGIVHRELADADLYFVANTGPQVRTVDLTPRTPRDHFTWWDPHDGVAYAARPLGRGLTVTLHPYEAQVLIGTDGDAPGPALRGDAETLQSGAAAPEVTLLEGPWTFAVADADADADAGAGEATPAVVTLPHRWEDELPHYSGTGTYEASVTVDAAWFADEARIVLDLGPCLPSAPSTGNGYRAAVQTPVREVAVVAVNGHEVGVIWDAPYELDVTSALVPGQNTLRLRVHNTAAGAVASDEHAAGTVAAAHQAYGVRFQQQDLERAMDGVSSGLQAVPALRRVLPDVR